MTTQQLLAVIGLLLALALLSRFGPIAWRSWQIYAGTRSRRLVDAGPLEIPPPDSVATRLQELGTLGFTRIGERSLVLPGRGVRYEWNVGDETGSTYVSAVPTTIGAIIVFYSSFEDGTWVQTMFPRGETIRRPNFFASSVAQSLPAALEAHRKQVGELRAAHGRVRPVRTMADTLRMDADYRSRFGGMTLRRLTVSNIMPGLSALALAVICLLILLLSR